MNETLARLRPGEDFRAYIARRGEIISENVSSILDSVSEFDAFDIIELMRQREMPVTLTGYKESQAEGRVAIIEIVALVLLARGSRVPISGGSPGTAPNQIIEDLHSQATAIFTVGTLALLNEGSSGKYGPLTRLAFEYRSGELNVRGKQYAHIQDGINAALFGTGNLVLDAMGFSFDDFLEIRQAVQDLYIEKFNQARDRLAEVIEDWRAKDYGEQSPSQLDAGKSALTDMFVYPGQRASFTAGEVSRRVGADPTRINAILNLFSATFAESEATGSVEAFLDGENSFSTANLITDGGGTYVTMHAPIGSDCFRQVLEQALKQNAAAWRRYDRQRARVSESLAVQHLESLLGVSATRTQVKYFRPKRDVEVSKLSSNAVAVTEVGDVAEADALFVIGDVAICVEVKGRSISSGARQGNVRRLTSDLEAIVGEASAQARRLERLIEKNRGLWLEDRSWLDLSNVREVRSVAVCLDDLGILAVAVDELLRCGVIRDKTVPWVVSLHDLAIIAEVLDRPAEFLLYLRRRTEPGVSRYFSAVDELDLFMLFLDGGLYVEANPDKMYAKYPASGKPTRADRERYKAKAVPTRVHTHTDSLDAWVYFNEGFSGEEVEKPRFSAASKVLDIVDFLQDGQKPGWFRFGADLLGLSAEAQESLEAGFDDLVRRTRLDHRWHSAAYSSAGESGFHSFFMCSQPRGMSSEQARERMGTYLAAKKHQLQSDRALGVVVNQESEMVAVQYDNSLPADDPDLDRVGDAIGLQPVHSERKRMPSSSRRAAQRGRRMKKRRR